jgi:excinuclease ABC subunit A
VHSHNEINRPDFWKFVDQAVAGFQRFTDRARQKPEDLMPWKVLGRKWHLARKGFALGKQVQWEAEVLERLLDLVSQAAPHGQFLWDNKQVVPVYVSGQKEPWAAVQTKKLDAVYLTLTGPKGRFAQGRITDLGHNPHLDAQRPDKDLIRLQFRSTGDLERGNLAAFLKEHLATVTGDG